MFRCSSAPLLAWALVVACGSAEPAPTATTAATTNTSGAESAAPSAETEGTPPPSTASSCDAYLAHYRRCEAVLQPGILAGDRRSADAEEGWIRYLESSTEAPGVPTTCEQLDSELSAACP